MFMFIKARIGFFIFISLHIISFGFLPTTWPHGYKLLVGFLQSRKVMGNQFLPMQSENVENGRLYSKIEHGVFNLSTTGSSSERLLQRWKEIILNGKIRCSTKDKNGREIMYGLKLENDEIEEFCKDVKSGKNLLLSKAEALEKECGCYPVFLAQNRRLRPPAAPKLSELPPHDEEQCSMCTGPIRLEIRERVAELHMAESDRTWDCHFNISPMTPKGHFLLVPDLTQPKNRRAQHLTLEDCIDLVDMGRCLPGLCINYNSPNAGASQNHIHAHAWVHGTDEEPYPSQKAEVDLNFGAYFSEQHSIKAFVKNFPASCIVLQGEAATQIGTVMHQILTIATSLDLAFNVATFDSEAYIFLRLKEAEIIPKFVPDLKIGSCQILGLWAVDTEAQYESLTQDRIDGALRCTRIADSDMFNILKEVFEVGIPH